MTREHAYKLREMMYKASVSLTDNDALEAVELFPLWKVDTDYAMGVRLRYEERLYKTLQAHRSAAQWTPDITPALYTEVEEQGQGDTPDNPIRYNNNMELFEGKYYEQYDIIYICIRSTGVPVYNNLADLVNIYVQVYE